MFGKRADGWLVKNIDPIVGLVPYFMPMRCDSQVMMGFNIDYEKLARYIVKKGNEGYKISFMDILIASYVRTIAALPEVNRFIVNKRMYARNEITVSFVLLRNSAEGNIEENTVKCRFDPHDTIYDVSARIEEIIKISRQEEPDNSTMKVVKALKSPAVANFFVLLLRFLDRYGLIPKKLLDASPFHTGMFLANMASIGMPAVRHHIYNFGTTSQFFSMGTIKRSLKLENDGKITRKREMPIGVVADERVCTGYMYSRMVISMRKYLENPELLESPPEAVFFDEGHVYGLQPIKKKKKKFFSKHGKSKRKRYREAV
jgi:hypothetical protein